MADYIVSYRYDIDDWAPCVREDLDGLDALSLPDAVFSSEAEARAFIATMCGLMHMGGNPEDFRIERRN